MQLGYLCGPIGFGSLGSVTHHSIKTVNFHVVVRGEAAEGTGIIRFAMFWQYPAVKTAEYTFFSMAVFLRSPSREAARALRRTGRALYRTCKSGRQGGTHRHLKYIPYCAHSKDIARSSVAASPNASVGIGQRALF